jgi:hypothetical protein
MVTESLVLEKPAPGIGLAVGLRTYLEIVKVEAPSEASYGTTVTINIYVKNKWTSRIFATVTGAYDTAPVTGDSHYIEPGAQRIFGLSFTMPNKTVNLWIWAWYWTETGWSTSPDDEYGPVKIALAKWALLASKTLMVKYALPPVVGWTLLASKTLTVKVYAVPPPVGWTLLASKTLTVKPTAPPPVGWTLLASKTLTIKAGPLSPRWELIQDTIYQWGYTYRGDAEVCTWTFAFPPEQIPGVDWLAKKLVEIMASTLEDNNSKLLELKLWRDASALMYTDYRCEVTASASPLAWWAILIIVCGVIVAITFLIREIRKTWYEPHGLPEDVKAGYSHDTLVQMICETKPEQTPETLAGMTDDELRTLLNQKLAALQKGGWPWYVWLGITGIAIGGSLVGVTALRAFAPAEKEKKGK